eukprot:973875-Amorphochlora_amoeboformis.AAC.1
MYTRVYRGTTSEKPANVISIENPVSLLGSPLERERKERGGKGEKKRRIVEGRERPRREREIRRQRRGEDRRCTGLSAAEATSVSRRWVRRWRDPAT